MTVTGAPEGRIRCGTHQGSGQLGAAQRGDVPLPRDLDALWDIVHICEIEYLQGRVSSLSAPSVD